MVAYKYLPILSDMFPSPTVTINQDIIAGINDGFYEGYDWYTIQEETTRGLGICDKNIDARVNRAITAIIGTNRGDDFKKLSFNGYHNIQLGNMFYFSDNYWLVVNLESIKSPTSTCTVQRCNNMLRWMDSNGAIREYPCSIGYKITGAKDLPSRSGAFPIGQGMISVIVQNNAITSTIQPNQRFLFGNVNSWTAYKVAGGGVLNYNNLQTTSNTSYGTLELQMEFTAENSENDDFINGIANADKYDYTITLNPSSFSGVVGNTITLVPTVTLNGEVVTRTVTWSSATPTKATVGATTGLVTLVAVGSSIITCTLANNTSVHAHVTITVAATAPASTYSIRISPTTNSILLLDNQDYTVSLYTNGTLDTDTFTFTVDATSTAPTSSYDFTVVSTTKFNVENLAMSIGKPWIIRATSVTHSSVYQLFEFLLMGAY